MRLLASKFATEELPLLSGMGERLVAEYLRLLADYRPQEVKPGVVATS